MVIIKTENLVKRFKTLTAVDSVNLEIFEGECFGLLGPNGAGKTSLIRMITSVSPPNSGNVWVMGKKLPEYDREIKAKLGVVPQQDNLDPDLTVIQNLMTFARYFDIPKNEARKRSIDILEFFQLSDKLKSRLDEISGGMKRRLLIARSLINNPVIVILDEPSIGLDPQARHVVWQKLAELKAKGITELLCTQNMEEAAHLCDRVAIMDRGKIITLDTPERLISKYAGSQVWELMNSMANQEAILSALKAHGFEFNETGGKVNIFGMDNEAAIKNSIGGDVKLRVRPANLEDVFIKLTGRPLE